MISLNFFQAYFFHNLLLQNVDLISINDHLIVYTASLIINTQFSIIYN